jgi:dTDP-4-amino-4,6-dideoxygalactose transaminase
MDKGKINVTQPSLPPLSEYMAYLEKIWESGVLTNNGPMVQELEMQLAEFLSIKNFVAVSNGTIAIQMAIKALDLKGEIITTPFTWIATLSAIQWEKCTPIFCDIDPDTLNIDVTKIESLITNKTTAILPVHVFGNPCDVYEINKIAQKHNLKVIYDGAQALGSTIDGKSVLEYGDVSTVSLHATKLFNTAEGGGCITRSAHLHERLKEIRLFGYDKQKSIPSQGLNGKMSEINAALGLSNIKYLENILLDRKKKYKIYADFFDQHRDFKTQKHNGSGSNCSYFAVICKDEDLLHRVQNALEKEHIYGRRYFYPSLDQLSQFTSNDQQSHSIDISKRIFCLPLYFGLKERDIERIIKLICNMSK